MPKHVHNPHAFVEKNIGKKKEKERASGVEEQLLEIYENPDGSMPTMDQFERGKGRRLVRSFVLLGGACLFLALTAWAGFFLFHPAGSFIEEDIVLAINGNESPVFGEQATYRIRYANAQRRPLAQATLEVRYPAGFVFENASVPPVNEKGDTWEIGTLGEDDGGTIDITGRWYAEPNKEQSFRFFLNYTPSNFSSEFQKVVAFPVTPQSPALTMAIAAPESAEDGQPLSVTIILEPTESWPTPPSSSFALALEGNGFHVEESQPEMKEGKARWPVASVQEKTTITLKGFFEAGVLEPSFDVVLLGAYNGKNSGEYLPLLTERHAVTLKKNSVSISLTSKSHESGSLQPGDVLFLSMTVKNTSQDILKKPAIRLVLDTPSVSGQSILFWNKLDDAHNGEVSGEQIADETRRGTILWDRRHIPNFVYMGPGESFDIDIQIPVKTKDEADLSAFPGTAISAVAYVDFTGDDGKQETAGSAKKEFVIHSDLEIATQDTVTENRHKITWILSNTMHPLSGITVAADLFGDITWHDDALVVPAGTATYDRDAKRLVWQIPEMPIALDVLALQFAVTLDKPNAAQTQLTGKPIVNATDTITGAQLLAVGQAVTL